MIAEPERRLFSLYIHTFLTMVPFLRKIPVTMFELINIKAHTTRIVSAVGTKQWKACVNITGKM